MATERIDFDDKVGIIPRTVRINQVWDIDMNLIKDVVNTNADELDAHEAATNPHNIEVDASVLVEVYNATAFTIEKGFVVYPVGTITGTLLNIELARADSHETISDQLGLANEDILTGTSGFVRLVGKLEDIDTSALTVGAIYLSPIVSGGLTSTRPLFPNYEMLVGVASVINATTGVIAIDINASVSDTFNNFYNGIIRETFLFDAVSNGTVITGSLTPIGSHPNLTLLFSDGFSTFNISADGTIVLTAGTDDNPQENYVYILKTTKLLTVSTAGFPAEEHAEVSILSLRSAATTQTDNALKNHNRNDHLASDGNLQGHLSHITARLRTLDARWESGIAGTATIDTGSNPDDVFVEVTAGVVRQLHIHAFPAIDTETTGDIHIVNNFANPFVTVSNLNTQILDSQNVTLNNTSFSFVIWGVINSGGEDSHLMLNLPSDSYAHNSPQDAVEDALSFSDYSIPKQFQGVGFLISRFTFTYKNNAWVLIDTEDLRGSTPNATAGGGIGSAGVTELTSLTDVPSSYATHARKVLKVNSAETDTEFKPVSEKELFITVSSVSEFVLSEPANNVDVTIDRVPQIETIDYNFAVDTVTIIGDDIESGSRVVIRKY